LFAREERWCIARPSPVPQYHYRSSRPSERPRELPIDCPQSKLLLPALMMVDALARGWKGAEELDRMHACLAGLVSSRLLCISPPDPRLVSSRLIVLLLHG